MIREGAKVSYVGDGEDGLKVGDQGKVVSSEDSAAHVRWTTGARTNQVTFHDEMDLVVGAKLATHDNGFDAGLVHIAVRDTYDAAGPVGLLNALNEDGHLATFASYAESALEAVSASIRTDPSMREVLANLEPEEQASFVSLAAGVLLRDAFGGEEV